MSGVRNREVTAEDDDIRVDRWFRRHFPDLKHGRLEKLLRTDRYAWTVASEGVDAAEAGRSYASRRCPPPAQNKEVIASGRSATGTVTGSGRWFCMRMTMSSRSTSLRVSRCRVAAVSDSISTDFLLGLSRPALSVPNLFTGWTGIQAASCSSLAVRLLPRNWERFSGPRCGEILLGLVAGVPHPGRHHQRSADPDGGRTWGKWWWIRQWVNRR